MLEPKKCPVCNRRFAAEQLFCPDDGGVLKLASQVDLDPLVGQTLEGQFLIESILYSGATGTVYKASQVPLERTVAVKVLGPLASRDKETLSRFFREARVGANLEHPNLVKVFFLSKLAEERPYFVMDYYQGVSVADVIAKEKKISLERSCNIVLQLCDALSAMHAHGIVHNDIKKENVLLVPSWAGSVLPNTEDRPRDIVKLCDFGIASFAQASNDGADVRDDVRALGFLAYELLVADASFRKDQESIIDLKVHRASRHVPIALANAVMRAIEKDPARRFQTVQAFAGAVRASMQGLQVRISMPLTQDFESQPRPEPGMGAAFKIALGGVIGLSLVLLGAWALRHTAAQKNEAKISQKTHPEAARSENTQEGIQAGKIEVMPSAPRANDNVSLIAVWPSAVKPNTDQIFVVRKKGDGHQPVELRAASVSGSSSPYIASFRFPEPGEYLVEFASIEAFHHSGPRIEQTVQVMDSLIPRKPRAAAKAPRSSEEEPLRGQLTDWPSEAAPEEQTPTTERINPAPIQVPGAKPAPVPRP
jgi:serine/threonine-protein kinase